MRQLDRWWVFLGVLAIQVLPFTHGQPNAFVEGQKGCGGFHTLGISTQEDRKTEARQYYKYGMDCQNCHTRHAFSAAEAREPEACQTCHQGFDHPQWEMWSTSKHGVTDRNFLSPTSKVPRPSPPNLCAAPDDST